MAKHDCGPHLLNCEDCNMPLCPECEWEGCGEDANRCPTCHEEMEKKRAAEFAWMAPLVARHVDACRSLDIPTSSTDAEVMEAARRLK